MKILVLTTTFPRWKGDVRPAFVFDLCKMLHSIGCDVVVLAPHDDGAKKYEVMDCLTVYRYPYFFPYNCQKLVYGGGIWPNFKQSFIAKLQVPFLLLSGIYHTIKIARKENVTVIHSHWVIPNGLMGAICSHLQGRNHIITSHGADIFVLEKMPFKKMIAGYIFKHTNHVTVVSSQILKKIRCFLPDNPIIDRITVLPMGIDLNTYRSYHLSTSQKSVRENGKKTLLAIGRLVDKKGFSYLINSMPMIIEKCPDTELIICGDGPLRNDLEHAVKKLGLDGSVIFKGFVSDRDKINYLQNSDILILPSIMTKSGDTEGLPVVLLEGMASGIPVIATDVGGIGDVIVDRWNGLLIQEKSSDMIAEKVIELLSSPQLMSTLSQNARESIGKYSWDVIGRKYCQIMEDSLL